MSHKGTAYGKEYTINYYIIHLVTTTKLKRIHIREKSDPVTTATVDDIKASLRGFQLSPVLPKAGSLNALNSKITYSCDG